MQTFPISLENTENMTFLKVNIPMTVETVMQLRNIGEQLLYTSPYSQVVINLHAVVRSDSSALALLTAWARAAKKVNKSIRFIETPTGLMTLAKLSHLEKILTLEPIQ